MIVGRLEQFWKMTDRREADECWLWKGARTEGGYGQMGSGAARRGKPLKCLATHVALAVAGRARPSSRHQALHSCDTPLCVNPGHLRWGTPAENMQDKIARGRQPSGPRLNRREEDRHANAKLDATLVRYIRTSPATSLELAAELGVTNQCISQVRRRATWAHVG